MIGSDLCPGTAGLLATVARRLERPLSTLVCDAAAVPLDEPEPLYGHLRRFDVAALHRLGRGTGLPYRVDVHHGGWLVIDHPSTPDKGPERGCS